MRLRSLTFKLAICLFNTTCALAVSFQTAGPADPNAASSNANAFDDHPRIATDGAGHWVAVWETAVNAAGPNPIDPDIAVSRSSDNGATWTAPALLNSNAGQDTVEDVTPCIATDKNGTWVCVYTGASMDNPPHRAVLASKSTDNGATWSSPVTLNPADALDVYSYSPCIASDANGHWVVVWHSSKTTVNDPNTDDPDIRVSTSTNGTTWTAPAMLNSAYASESAQDINAKVSSDGNGVWVCAWASDYNRGIQGQGDREIAFARSTDNGATWSPQAVLNSEFDTETGLDEDLNIANDGSGNWIITWEGYIGFGRYRVWSSTSTDDGQTWSTRKQVSDDAGDLDNVFPDIATDQNGKWIVVWQRYKLLGGSNDYDILKSESSDNGATWSAVELLNSNALTDTTDDWNPAIATDGADHWVVLWQAFDPMFGDHDVWRAISGAGGGGSLTIITPNGGEKWKIGKKKSIEWTSSGDPGTDVKLELLKNGGVVTTIKGSTPNDGKQKWKLPNSLAPGKGYKVRITSKSDGSINDTSDGSFKIKAAK